LDFPGLKEPTDAFHQAPEGIKIDLVLASEAVEHLGLGRLGVSRPE